MEFNWKTNKIKKVNLLDGTKVKQVDVLKSGVRTTVYKAQTDLIVNGAVQSALGSLTLLKQQYNSALTYSGDYVHLQNQNSGSVSRVDSANKIEWSQYSTMKIELGASDCKYSTVLVNIAKNVTVPTWWWMGSSPNATYTQKAWGWSNKTWSSGTILTLDVSDCTEKGILMIGIKDNVGDFYIKNIWLE